jgi:gag-polyprotein putative aspartyl protease
MSQSIEWRHDGRRVILPVTILPPDPAANLTGHTGNALLDTGSTTSAVTPRVVRAINLRPLGKRVLGSAQGEGMAERYIFRIGLHPATDQPAFPFIFQEIVGFELTDSFQFDALIGMDILSQCDFSMSQSRLCRLSFG